ncbi:hypothetical protein P167DRAFT_564632 [Morchella conica CCBAS932]|uniref:Uncharacterized protein n=1 Tax=Morchella conica CCBAS932 TaxID=1392247 RepID=A0A3N4L629_9PEZI|nr:hypothetical protein P167DRAFT_564632 [Morchella conica CCBAS932]
MSLNHYADTSHMILYSCNLLVVFTVMTFEFNFRTPLKRDAPAPAPASMTNDAKITPGSINDLSRLLPPVPSIPPAPVVSGIITNGRGTPIGLRDIRVPFMPGQEEAPDRDHKPSSKTVFQPVGSCSAGGPQGPATTQVKYGLEGTQSLEVVAVPPPSNRILQAIAPLNPALHTLPAFPTLPAGHPAPQPQSPPEKSLAELIAEAEKRDGEEAYLKRDRRYVPPVLSRAIPAPASAMSALYPRSTSSPQPPPPPSPPPPLPAHNYRRGFIDTSTRAANSRPELVPPYLPQQKPIPPQPKALRRVALLGLCTTLEINALPDNERMTLRTRLCKILLTRTTENTMYYNEATSRAEHLSEVFECGVLDAFEYAGLDLSGRVWVKATKKTPEGGMAIAGDDVGALLWVKGLVGEMTMDDVSRRELVLWANNVRRRMVGMPASPIWMRELIDTNLIFGTPCERQ